ncbi:MAG TPA: flagellar export protein FliJ [Verrucomicrobiae bacterium]|nr:flagellar export protein FliJ [Verrucomicrobiae bacterium]
MKAFRFSLQPIRVLREQKEQKSQQAFSRAMRLHEQAALQLKVASDELLAAWNALCRETSAGVNAAQLSRTRTWCNSLELRQKECAEAAQRARRAMDAAMREMLVATRDRKAIDQYHERCRDTYNLAAQREEQKILDELGIRRAPASALSAMRR